MSSAELAELDAALIEAPPVEQVERFMQGEPVTQGVYMGPLADAPDGIYVSPDSLDGAMAELPNLRAVEWMPGAQLGAGNSHHGVVFGNVTVQVGEQISQLPVAFKSFTTESEQAANEHNNLVAARERGFDTFQPLALAKDGENTYLITEYRDEIESLDNVDWTIPPQETERYQNELVPNLEFVVESMALLHSRGIFHGDASPKNFARTDTGSLVVIDLEVAKVANSVEEHRDFLTGGWDPHSSKASEDVWHCFYDMVSGSNDPKVTNLFLLDQSADVFMEEFENNLLGPYFKKLQEVTDPSLFDQVSADELRASMLERAERMISFLR